MRKKDILELKRRLKKEDCTFTKMCGCYVNGEKNIILNFKETFLNLEEDEFFKYLEIAKKVLSGTIGNNLLELNFPVNEEYKNDKQSFLMSLKKSKLKDDTLLDSFYKSIIDSYDYTGNFLILVFHDAYDVITKTRDNLKLDESEEVYEYLLCAICPVSLSKPALGYFEEDNKIAARVRDWVVEAPVNGFVFPAFIDRSSDVNSIMYYTKNPKDSHPELMEEALGCSSKRTATEQKETFHNIITNAIGYDEEKSNNLFMEIQENINSRIDEHTTVNGKDSQPIILTNDTIQDILAESGVSEEDSSRIERFYTKEFGTTLPIADDLIDAKILKASEQKKKEQKLEKEVEILQNKLENTNKKLEEVSKMEDESEENYDIILKVKPEKASQIKSQIIEGQKYIVIPVEENEQTNVNGVDTKL
ncbi:MAG: DUF4317 domain-containing protein [Clostridium sp.]|jgi:hypothetical protein|nr:DUF4317 domain-containing protein [Clostridium sp.]